MEDIPQSHVHDVGVEFTKVRAEISSTGDSLKQTFAESLQIALNKQDQRLQNNFTELKTLMLQRLDRPVPQKKAKLNLPHGQDSKEEDERL